MKTYSFFGHRDAPESIKPLMKNTILDLIHSEPDCEFLVGNNGHFDRMAASVLRALQKEGYDFSYYVVLSYLPTEKTQNKDISPDEPTLFPEGLETAPKRFAIVRRNQWMVQNSDGVICYIRHWYGGAANAVEYAKKKHKSVINLEDYSL